MLLKVISLKGIEYEGDVVSLNIQTTSGEITVLENHRPLITLLKPGLAVIIEQKNQKKEMEINGGFLEVAPRNKINVLVD
ncbi:MAG: ATP synthase F1 subunit epsilon [Candidatus Liptonbacteria bacterium]|nr:ATP synthase F1 subunit epsilon [Candidatus Liptonbacteria bacterium]